jgi:hypothetical protein
VAARPVSRSVQEAPGRCRTWLAHDSGPARSLMLCASGPVRGERVFGLSRPGRQVAADDHFEGHFEGQNAASAG